MGSHNSYSYLQENLMQWNLSFGFLFRSRFTLFFFCLLGSHHSITFKKLLKSQFILDVGCGRGLPWRILKRLGLNPKIIAVDAYVPYLRKIKELGIYEDRVLAVANHLPFRKNVFDTITSFQMLEHLSKKDGTDALQAMSSLADTVVVTTPVSFINANIDQENSYQTHKSGWMPEEMKKIGYEPKGYGWFKISGNESLAPFLLVVNIILLVVIRRNPKSAFHMHCVKSAK